MPLAALSDQPGGLESPHHSTYPIPFHSNMDFHYLSHHVAHYNPTPGHPSANMWLWSQETPSRTALPSPSLQPCSNMQRAYTAAGLPLV